MAHDHHPNLPLASALMAIFAIVSDLSASPAFATNADVFFSLYAHVVASLSGTIALILAIFAIKEKFFPKKPLQ